MTTFKTDRVMPALEPVRAELIRRATADAERMTSDAQHEASRVVENARNTARSITEKACAAGEAAGASVAAADTASLRRTLRRDVLGARDDAYRQWRRGSHEAVLRLRDEPDYARWRDALVRTAHEALGDDAHVVDDPDGGIVAEREGRRLDLSLPAIAARALEQIAPEVGGLWS